MNREEIEKRMKICEERARGYREVGKTKIADKYDEEKYKWEKLLSNLELLNERKINELLDYKKGYYHQKEVIDKVKNVQIEMPKSNYSYDYMIYRSKIDEILKEVKND